VRGTLWFFVVPTLLGLVLIVGTMVIGRHLGLVAWPLLGGSAALGFLAWRYYEESAEHALLRGVAAAILLAVAAFGIVLPSLTQLFPSATLARVLRDSGCAQPLAAAAGFHEPSLVFLGGTGTVLTDGGGAATFLRGGDCRFAFIEARQERGFVQRAEAIGLRYTAGPRFDAVNIGGGGPITIAVFRSRGGP
jgi:hypothetical protein